MSITTMDKNTKKFLNQIYTTCKCALPLIHNKSEGEKGLDDKGFEFISSAYMFLYENRQPDEKQFQQLKEVAAAVAITYKNYREKFEDLDEQELGLYHLCEGFLYLWYKKVDFDPKSRKNLH